MNTALATIDRSSLAEQVAIAGDLSQLTADQRMAYYSEVCNSIGLNPRNTVQLPYGQKHTSRHARRNSPRKRNRIEWVSQDALLTMLRLREVALGSGSQGRTPLPNMQQQEHSRTAPRAVSTTTGSSKPNVARREDQGRERVHLRTCAAGRSLSSDGQQRGLRHATPSGDGPISGSPAYTVRTSPSQERTAHRQQHQQLGTVETLAALRRATSRLSLPWLSMCGAWS